MIPASVRTTLLPSAVAVLVVAVAGLSPTAAGATTTGDDGVKVLLVCDRCA